MCGRFALHSRPEVIALQFGVELDSTAFVPRYNIAPTSELVAVRADAHGIPRAALLRWGLLPRWARDRSIAAKLNNARAETVAEKPSFRDAWRRRRCLIPADGYYEWKRDGARKQPYYIRSADDALLAFGGLWERWEGPEGVIESCAIVTTEANAALQAVHDRMPVLVPATAYARWLDCTAGRDAVSDLLQPAPRDALRHYPVSTAVNRSSNEGPQLIEALAG